MTLTRTQTDLLRQLLFREAGPTGAPCWIVATTRNRYRLIVKDMGGRYVHHSKVQPRTLRTLHEAGLIQYGANQEMPDWFVRREDDAVVGSTVTLTVAGRKTIGGAA